MNRPSQKDNKIRIGITHGDFNGIGYEVIIKTFMEPRILDICTPIVYGSPKIAAYHRKALNITDFSFNIIRKAEQANPKRPNLVNIHDEEVKIELGQSSEIAGKLSLQSLEEAVKDLQNGAIDILVTAPINKKNIQSENFDFPGHTEYLAHKFKTDDYLMLMAGPGIRIGVITGHIPLKEVSAVINEDVILKKIKILNESLKVDFGIQKPRIAVLGLNPHAGDNGVLGDEEQKIITPAVKKAFDQQILAFGPYPADGFFGTSTYRDFDGILAMYHDQGLIPFKIMAFDEGINFTAGLPVIRTSPAHGTGYEIAGKNMAMPDSFRQAIFQAIDIFNKRQQHREITANPLQPPSSEKKV